MKVRFLLISVVVLFVACVLTVPSYAKIDIKTCVGMWLFNEDKGDTAADSSGNKNDGKIMNGPKLVDGKFGKALEFNGVDNYVQMISPDTARAAGQPMTAEARIYWKGGAGYQDIVTQREPHNWIFYLHQDNHELSFHGAAQYKSAYAMPKNEWKHVAATVTADGIATVYVDGVVVHTNPNYVYNVSASSNLQIGAAVGGEYFNGIIDDVAIFNVALTADDIKNIANNGLERALGLTPVSPKGRLTTVLGEIKSE